MAKARLGVALLLPPALAAEVDGLRRALGDGALGRIPSHLTLVPPVNVREERLGEALAVVRAAAAATRPFRLVLGPPATFLPVNPVVHLPVTGDAAALHALRDRVFTEPLARPLTWPFVPHVTLADDADPVRIEAAVAALDRYRVEADFDRVHLLRESPGRRWEPIADAPFIAPAVVGRGGLPLELAVSEVLDPEVATFLDREGEPDGERVEGELRPFAVTARRDGALVGAATGHTRGHTARLCRLAVGASHRGQGIGTQLVAAVEALAAGRGCRSITARTSPQSRADTFLRGRGWTEEGQLPPWAGGHAQPRRDPGG